MQGSPTRPTARALRVLSEADPRMGRLLRQVGPFPDLRRRNTAGSHFHALARSILYQQLAGKAAATIHGRVRRLTPGPRFPTAKEVLQLDEQAFRSAGVSAGKRRAIVGLAESVEAGTLSLRSISRLPDPEIVARLSRLHGIGEWTAQMFLMFRLGRLDVMPTGDLGVREGLRVLDGLARRPSPSELNERAEAWRPLRSVATWCLYRAADSAKRGAAGGS